MSEFITPALLITEYYDILIKELDILTEEQINEYKDQREQEDKLNEVRQNAIKAIRKEQDKL